MPHVVSNINVYLAIATEALESSKRADSLHRIPKHDGSEGWGILDDPTRSSFKQSLIAIVFAGVYLDALLYIVGTRLLGRAEYEKIEKRLTYEAKLKTLQITDTDVLDACRRFRESRNDIAHEKARDWGSLTEINMRTAQREAEHALTFVKHVSSLLSKTA